MPDVRQIAEEIVAREGGYVNDPSDPGGATNHGVTLGTLRALGRDLTGDGHVDVADVRAITDREAVDIFLTQYFDRPGLGRLPDALQPSVFDMYVNAGIMAVKLLQRVLKAAGYALADDGAIGPQTLAAARTEAAKDAEALVDRYGVARRDFYYSLADARPASRKYARRKDGGKGGWITRAEAFISPALRLTDAQHQARVAAWN
ncbi:peptidoglycan-binding protein [bacterium]|nr:peptidoglycan-binding protein [bacterium]